MPCAPSTGRGYMTPEHTLAVDCNVRDSHITHSKYAALKVKDAICDQFISKCGKRPSVDVEQPMVGLNLHIYKDTGGTESGKLGRVAAQARLSAHPHAGAAQ